MLLLLSYVDISYFRKWIKTVVGMEQLVLVALCTFASRTKQLSEWNNWFLWHYILSQVEQNSCRNGTTSSCAIMCFRK